MANPDKEDLQSDYAIPLKNPPYSRNALRLYNMTTPLPAPSVAVWNAISLRANTLDHLKKIARQECRAIIICFYFWKMINLLPLRFQILQTNREVLGRLLSGKQNG